MSVCVWYAAKTKTEPECLLLPLSPLHTLSLSLSLVRCLVLCWNIFVYFSAALVVSVSQMLADWFASHTRRRRRRRICICQVLFAFELMARTRTAVAVAVAVALAVVALALCYFIPPRLLLCEFRLETLLFLLLGAWLFARLSLLFWPKKRTARQILICQIFEGQAAAAQDRNRNRNTATVRRRLRTSAD